MAFVDRVKKALPDYAVTQDEQVFVWVRMEYDEPPWYDLREFGALVVGKLRDAGIQAMLTELVMTETAEELPGDAWPTFTPTAWEYAAEIREVRVG